MNSFGVLLNRWTDIVIYRIQRNPKKVGSISWKSKVNTVLILTVSYTAFESRLKNQLVVVHQQNILGQPFKVYGSIEEALFLTNELHH